MPLSPPTALGGSAFLFLIIQIQATHGAQSMGFCFFILFLFLPPTPNPLINAFKPTHCAGWVAFIYLPFIWMSLIKDRGVAMGKPHCNYSI
ncbi:MAG: hypothetical protein DWH70_00325 [Planctomycetota bacterium]|nr:MAG: hypothetical protein DWH70_00325 [Planctomycetota bacterium]